MRRASHCVRETRLMGDAGNIMTEYNYPECTTSVITALSIFRKHNAEYRSRDIQYALRTSFRLHYIDVSVSSTDG